MNNSTPVTYTIRQIAAHIGAAKPMQSDFPIRYLQTDSRRIISPTETLFFALGGPRRSGEDYIPELIKRGVRAFVVQDSYSTETEQEIVLLRVPNVRKALQQLAAFHRSLFTIPVIGITGSNGKTIVKEWLYQLMQGDQVIVRSPRSYNSQIGVPLSVWQMNQQHTLGIFEAGISTNHEMLPLQQIIQPTIGIFTNLSDAHSEGFSNRQQKLQEKAQLFSSVNTLVYALDEVGQVLPVLKQDAKVFTWSRKQSANLAILSENVQANQTAVHATYQQKDISITIPFTDRISINNALTCWLTLFALGYSVEEASSRLGQLQPLDMRMQLVKGILGCTIINDSYSNDETALALAIDYQMKQAGELIPLVILSDIPAPESPDAALYPRLAAMMKEKGVREIIGIGSNISQQANAFKGSFVSANFYPDTESFLAQLAVQDFQNRIILLKGARVFAFERIAQQLELKTHQTELSINLSALVRNVQKHQSILQPSTKMMVVLKAFGYGTGSAEIAKLLAHQQVHYLAVAYVDEGIELRKAGISLPIMVMNAEESAWDALIQYQLEPEIYSLYFLHRFLHFLQKQGLEDFPVHLKINSGMNRLGFNPEELPALCSILKNTHQIRIQTVFSHFIASENPAARVVTEHQLQMFTTCCKQLAGALPYPFIRHIANSAAIQMHPASQLDMVRLGMGMYGGNQHNTLALEPVARLTSTIAQIRKVGAGETVGYGLDAVMKKDTTLAIVNIGYADGYPRSLGMGNGEMWVGNQRAKLVGHVCMDMAMIDVSGIPDLFPGATVEVFGPNIPIAELASRAGTIPYEIMTGISQRVKRVFWEE